MRRDKTVARFLFILSVVHVVVAAPAVVSRRFLDEAEGLTPVLEKRVNSDGEWSPDSFSLPQHPHPVASMNTDPGSDSKESVNSPELAPGSSHSEEPRGFGDLPPNSGTSQHGDSLPVSTTSPTHGGFPPESATQTMHDDSPPDSGISPTHGDSLPVSAVPSTHYESAPDSATPPTHDDPLRDSGTPPTHDDSLPVSTTSPNHGGFPPESATQPTHGDLPPVSGTSPTHDDSLPVSAVPSTHYESAPVSATPPTHDDPLRDSGTSPTHEPPTLPMYHDLPPVSVTPPTLLDPEPGTPEFDDDSHWWILDPATGKVIPPTHHEPEPGTPQFHDDSHWTPDTEIVPENSPPHEGSAQTPHGDPRPKSAAEAEDNGKKGAPSDAGKFLTNELKQKVMEYAILGTVAGASLGLLGASQKEIMGFVAPGASTVQIGRDFASNVVGRGEGMLLHGLPGHFQPRKRGVSRGLTDLRDEDLRLLSVLTRRALERPD